MDWKSNQRKKRSNHFIILFLSILFSISLGAEEFALILGKNSTPSLNVFGNLDSYKIYFSIKQNSSFKEIVLLNEIEGTKSLNKKPSKEIFLSEWNRLSKLYNKGLIYISADGKMDKEGFPVIELQENEAVSLKEFIQTTNSLNKTFLIFLDICKTRTTQLYPKEKEQEEYKLSQLPSQFIVFLSSNEKGYCYYKPKESGSFFTNQILELLGNKNFLNIEKFSKQLQKKWEEAQKSLKEENRESYFTWNTNQKLKILSSAIHMPSVQTLEYFHEFQPFFSSVLFNQNKERFYQVHFESSLTVKPKLVENINQIYHEINSSSIRTRLLDEKSVLKNTLGFWKISENQFEFHHLHEGEFTKTSFETYSHVVKMKRENEFGKNLLKDGIDWIEYRFSRGLLVLKLYKNKTSSLVQNKLGISATRYNYDEQGNLLQEEFFDFNKRLVENQEKVAKYFYEYGTSGNLERIRKYSKKETYIKHRPAIIHQKFNDRAQIVSIEYFENDEKPIQNELGIQKLEYIYENELLKEILFFSDYQKLRRFGYSTIKFDYNQAKLLVQKSFYSFIKKRTLDENGISIYKYLYDSEARLISTQFYNEEEKPIENEKGYHQIDYNYDKKKLIRESFYTLNGKPIQRDKTSFAVHLYDRNEKWIGKEEYNFLDQLLNANYVLELDNSLNPECSCKLRLQLNKFYLVEDLAFFETKNLKGGRE